MNIFSILLLFLEAFVIIALPIEEKRVNTFYNVLTKDCPHFNFNNTLFEKEDIFQKCTNWQVINETKALTDKTTETHGLCLLYYDAFVSFCTEISKLNVANITLTQLTPNVSNYNVSMICKNLALLPANKKFIHTADIIKTELNCNKLCSYYNGSSVKECGLAYYFSNYNASNVNAPKNANKTEIRGKPLVKSASVDELEATNLKETVQTTKQTVGVGEVATASKSIPAKNPLTETKAGGHEVIETSKEKTVLDQHITGSTTKKSTEAKNDASKEIQLSGIKQTSDLTDVNKSNNPYLDQTQSKVEDNTESPKIASEKNPSDTSQDEQTKFEIAQSETDQLAMDQQNQEDQAEQMIEENEDGGEGNDVGFPDKAEEEKLTKAALSKVKNDKPITVAGDGPANYNTVEDMDGESYFFSYFMVICVLFVLGYVGYHNRQKVMALVLEGKRGRRQVRGRRPNSANYHKLDSNLEEAISSTCTKNSSHVIY